MEANIKTNLQNPVINAFSIDVEGFVESNLQSFHVPDKYINQSEENREIERNTNALLQILDEADVKGTFFFIGRLTHDIPELIKTKEEKLILLKFSPNTIKYLEDNNLDFENIKHSSYREED